MKNPSIFILIYSPKLWPSW